MDLIIYHNACPDGFCAAFIAKDFYPEAQLIPRDHGLEPPYAEVEGKNVLVVDFSWRTREQNEKMASLARSFQIYDHHKTAEAILAGLPFATFDMNRSGAGLTYDLLSEKFAGDPQRPWFVDYVEDRDLWRHALPQSKEVNAYLGTLEFTLNAWEKMASSQCIESAARLGAGALAHINHYVREGRLQAQHGQLFFIDADGFVHSYAVKIVNALYMNISELAGALSEEAGIDIGIGYFERGDGKIQFSLRSRNADVDVSKLAQIRGGGGHKGAAEFQLNVAEGRNLIDSILGRPFVVDEDRVFQAPPIISLDKNVFRV